MDSFEAATTQQVNPPGAQAPAIPPLLVDGAASTPAPAVPPSSPLPVESAAPRAPAPAPLPLAPEQVQQPERLAPKDPRGYAAMKSAAAERTENPRRAKAPGKPGRKADPNSARAQRTVREKKARALEKLSQATTDAERAEAQEELAAAERLEQQRIAAPQDGQPRNAREDLVEEEAQLEEAPKPPAGPPPRPRYMGQDAERVATYASAVLPALEAVSRMAASFGVDVETPRERVLFRGIPGLERTVAAEPVARMAELLGVEAAARFSRPVGEEDATSDRRAELLLLAGATFGPALLRFAPALAQVPVKVLGGIKQVAALFRRRR